MPNQQTNQPADAAKPTEPSNPQPAADSQSQPNPWQQLLGTPQGPAAGGTPPKAPVPTGSPAPKEESLSQSAPPTTGGAYFQHPPAPPGTQPAGPQPAADAPPAAPPHPHPAPGGTPPPNPWHQLLGTSAGGSQSTGNDQSAATETSRGTKAGTTPSHAFGSTSNGTADAKASPASSAARPKKTRRRMGVRLAALGLAGVLLLMATAALRSAWGPGAAAALRRQVGGRRHLFYTTGRTPADFTVEQNEDGTLFVADNGEELRTLHYLLDGQSHTLGQSVMDMQTSFDGNLVVWGEGYSHTTFGAGGLYWLAAGQGEAVELAQNVQHYQLDRLNKKLYWLSAERQLCCFNGQTETVLASDVQSFLLSPTGGALVWQDQNDAVWRRRTAGFGNAPSLVPVLSPANRVDFLSVSDDARQLFYRQSNTLHAVAISPFGGSTHAEMPFGGGQSYNQILFFNATGTELLANCESGVYLYTSGKGFVQISQADEWVYPAEVFQPSATHPASLPGQSYVQSLSGIGISYLLQNHLTGLLVTVSSTSHNAENTGLLRADGVETLQQNIGFCALQANGSAYLYLDENGTLYQQSLRTGAKPRALAQGVDAAYYTPQNNVVYYTPVGLFLLANGEAQQLGDAQAALYHSPNGLRRLLLQFESTARPEYPTAGTLQLQGYPGGETTLQNVSAAYLLQNDGSFYYTADPTAPPGMEDVFVLSDLYWFDGTTSHLIAKNAEMVFSYGGYF